MTIEPVPPEHALRLCVLGDFDGEHTRSWLRYFVQRGHEVHAVSYYPPADPPEGVRLHVLRPAAGATGAAAARAGRRLPPSAQRLLNVLRYRRAGLKRLVHELAPDVFHAHYLVEHGLYGTEAAYHPYVVSAWGSDVLVEAAGSRLNRAIARFVLRRTDLATANNRFMVREMVLKLGIERAFVQHIVLGVGRDYLEAGVRQAAAARERPTAVISTRSLDSPLYNVDVIVRAMARVRKRLPDARLVVAGDGRLRPEIEALAQRLGLGEAVRFAGFLSQAAFREALADAEVFVSIPSSDGTSVALLQAMAAGCFPVVSDLRSQEELVKQGVQGLRVPPADEGAVADALVQALEDRELRRSARERNLRFVQEYGVLETNMARMESWYYRLAGRPEEVQPSPPAQTGLQD